MNLETLRELAEDRALVLINKRQFAELIAKEIGHTGPLMFLFTKRITHFVYNYMRAYRDEYNAHVSLMEAISEKSEDVDNLRYEYAVCGIETRAALHTLMTCNTPGTIGNMKLKGLL